MAAFESRAVLETLLLRLARLISADPAFTKASAGEKIIIRFEFPDVGVLFHVSLGDGQVEAGLGEPPESATIALVLDSDIFDRIFSGQLNPVKAAMRGELSFSGNVAVAMRFQGLMSEFVRLYQQAKEQLETAD